MMNTAQLMTALAIRYKAPEWAFMPQVADGTGTQKVRTCDALAMSLWPSRGLELHGFEVKAYRSDWQKELATPAKAESICRYCDYWWIVIGDPKIVVDGELPSTWGLLTPKGKGLAVSVKAPKLTPTPMDRSFLAAMLRKASEYVAPKWVAPIQELERSAWDAAYKEGEDSARNHFEYKMKSVQTEADRIKKAIDEFQAASGLRIDHWQAGDIGEAVKIVMHRENLDRAIAEIERSAERAEHKAKSLREELAILKNGRHEPTVHKNSETIKAQHGVVT